MVSTVKRDVSVKMEVNVMHRLVYVHALMAGEEGYVKNVSIIHKEWSPRFFFTCRLVHVTILMGEVEGYVGNVSIADEK